MLTFELNLKDRSTKFDCGGAVFVYVSHASFCERGTHAIVLCTVYFEKKDTARKRQI